LYYFHLSLWVISYDNHSIFILYVINWIK
jgi:hypothetical protein